MPTPATPAHGEMRIKKWQNPDEVLPCKQYVPRAAGAAGTLAGNPDRPPANSYLLVVVVFFLVVVVFLAVVVERVVTAGLAAA